MSRIDEAISEVWETSSELLANDARAELAQLRDDYSRACDAVTKLDAQVAEQARRIAEFESGDLVAALLDANRTQADRIIEQTRQLEEARQLLTTLEWNDWDDRVDAWLAANPAPEGEPQPPNGEGRP